MQLKMNGKKVAALIIAIIVIDQILKFYIKLNFFLGEEHQVIGSWFRLHFVENEGMAWGAKLSDISSYITDSTAKLFLSLFRVFAVCGIGYWLFQSLQKQASTMLIVSVTLVFSGALGNIIDSVSIATTDSCGHLNFLEIMDLVLASF